MKPLISDEVRHLVGKTRTRVVAVTAREIRHFAQAIGETNPIHFDEAHARAKGYPGIVAPPLFCQTLTYDDLPPEQLPPDGSPLELSVPVPAHRAVGGGSEYTIHRLVRADDVITITSTLKDVYTKEGRTGVLYMIVVETRFTDAQGLAIANEVATYIKRA